MSANFDARELRQVLGAFTTGVTIITTLDKAGQPLGLTANSFSSVSLDPPLVLWSQSVTAPSHPVFSETERFVVNILADDQLEISNRFARGGADKFAGLQVTHGLGGVPLIPGCSAYLECRRVSSFPGGDHTVFLGQVERIERNTRQPLAFGGGRYLVTQPHDLGPISLETGPNIARLAAIRIATRALTQLAQEADLTLGLGVWGNQGPTIVHWEASSDPVSEHLRTGLVLPVLSSATGLAFAAWLPSELTTGFIDRELAHAPLGHGRREGDQLAERLVGIRQSGAVRLVGTDEFTSLYSTTINAMSVPVFGIDGSIVLALTAIGAADRLDTAESGQPLSRLRECAASVTRRLRTAGAALSTSTD